MDREKRHILIVDDEASICDIIHDFLELQGFKCYSAHSVEHALKVLNEVPLDGILSDIRMPGLSGLDLLKVVSTKYDDMVLILFTGHADINTAITALQSGAYDFILKPIQLDHILRSLNNALEKKDLRQEVRHYRKNLELLVEERTTQIQETMQSLKHAHLEAIQILSRTTEFREDKTGQQSLRFRGYCDVLTKALDMPREEAWMITYASPLHDIGKVGVPDSILLKPGPLTSEELRVVQSHASIGNEILRNTTSRLLQVAAEIASSHHERWDGKGYPEGLSGETIPLSGRVVAIVDVFDTLTVERCYRSAFSLEQALDILQEGKGTHFDPKILDLFFENIEEIKVLYDTYHN
jgi:putative two-component system response regulator